MVNILGSFKKIEEEYKTVTLKRCKNVSQKFYDTKCEIKPTNKRFFLYPQRMLDCPNEFECSNAIGIILGKFDICCFDSIKNYYLEGVLRTKLYRDIPEIADILSIPCHRIRWNWQKSEKKYLFDLELNYKQYLKNGNVDIKLKMKFKKSDLFLENKAKVYKIDEKHWDIVDGPYKYKIEDTGTQLDVYREEVVVSNDTPFEKRIVAFTLIEPVRDPIIGRSRLKQKGIRTPIVSPAKIQDIIYRIGNLKRKMKEARIETFLTYTRYRILLKWEFDDILELDKEIRKLRNFRSNDEALIASTSTIVSLSIKEPEELWTWGGKVTSKDTFPCGLLLKIKAGNHEATVNEIRDTIQENLEIDVKDIIRYDRGSYWDVFFIVSIDDIRKLTYTVLSDIWKKDDVFHTSTIPLWKKGGSDNESNKVPS